MNPDTVDPPAKKVPFSHSSSSGQTAAGMVLCGGGLLPTSSQGVGIGGEAPSLHRPPPRRPQMLHWTQRTQAGTLRQLNSGCIYNIAARCCPVNEQSQPPLTSAHYTKGRQFV